MEDISLYGNGDENIRLSNTFTNNSLSKITFRKKQASIIPSLSLTSNEQSIIEDLGNVQNPSEKQGSDKHDLSANVDCLYTNTKGYYQSKYNSCETSSRNKKMEVIPETIETELNESISKISDEVDLMDSERLISNKCKIKGKRKKKKSKGGISFDFEDGYNSGALDSSYSVESQKKKGIGNKKRQRGSQSFVDEINICVHRSSMEPLEENKMVEKNCDTLDNTICMNIEEENSIEEPVIEKTSSRKKKKKKQKIMEEIILNSPKEDLLDTYKSVKNKIEEVSSESYESSNCSKKNKANRNHPAHKEQHNIVQSESLKDYDDFQLGTISPINNKKIKKKHKCKNIPDTSSFQRNKKILHKKTKLGSLNEFQESSKWRHVSVGEDEDCKKLSNTDDKMSKFTDSLNVVNNSENDYNNSVDHFSDPGTKHDNANNMSDQNASRNLISFILKKEGSKYTEKGIYGRQKHKNRNDKNKIKTKSSSKIAFRKETHIGKRISGNDSQLHVTKPQLVNTDEKDSKKSNMKNKSKSHKSLNSDIDDIRNKLIKAALKNIQKTKRHKRSAHKNIEIKDNHNHSSELNSGNKFNGTEIKKKLLRKRRGKEKINKFNDLTEMLISKVLKERENYAKSDVSRIEMKTVPKPKELSDHSCKRDKHETQLKKKKSKSLLRSKTDVKNIQQSLIDAAFKERNLNERHSKNRKRKQLQNSSAQDTFHNKSAKLKNLNKRELKIS